MVHDAQGNLLRTLLGSERLRFVDVGARGGIDERWRPFHGLLQVLAFEPDPEECSKLNGSASRMPYPIQFVPKALGAIDGEQASLNICKQPGCSSLLQPNLELCRAYPYGANMEVVKTWPMTLHRLDTVAAENGFAVDVIKIDTQGTELGILCGAGRLLSNMLIVELEVEFVSQYVDQPQACDVNLFMRQQGFVLRGLKRTYWRRTPREGWPRSTRGGQLLHGDALYVNSKLDSHDAGASRITILKGLIALAAYRQDDLILDLLSLPHPALADLSEAQRRTLAGMLIGKPPSGIRKLLSGFTSAAGYSNRQMRRWVDELRPAGAADWHDPDFY